MKRWIAGAALLALGGLLPACTRTDGKAPAPDTAHAGGKNVTAAAADAPPAGYNHLYGQKSLYLQQHMQNPVDWYPWGDAALGKARSEKKCVFLSIGYSSCHWCHVMEEEVFSQPDVASYMNGNYVCIKVDREERPDLDAAYMEALLALNNGQGGWPLNLWLTPDLQPVYGSTYLPKADFLQASQQVINASINNPDQVQEIGRRLAEHLSAQRETASAGELGPALLASAAAAGAAHADKQWGGMQQPQKFPLPVQWEFLLHYYRRTGDAPTAKLLRLTLDRMADGGLYDHIGGGFHRYSTDAAWVIPHFEKMLPDNAQLALLYTDAAQTFHDPRYAEVARDTLDFMLGTMSSPDGGFYSSIDARSGGVEGAYYVWTKQELLDAGGTDGAALAAALGVTDQPNFQDSHGKVSGSVLTRRAADPQGLFAKYRPALAALRAKRTAPGVDLKVVTAWNGLALSACARGYEAFGDRRYLDRAVATADFLWRVHHKADGSLYRASNGGAPEADAVLADYADLAHGLLDLYEASGRTEYLQQALDLIAYARQHFGDQAGGFYQTADGASTPLGRLPSLLDNVEPAGGSALTQAMLQAATLTGDEPLYTAAHQQLAATAGSMRTNLLEMAGWLQAAQLDLGPYYDVVVAGDPASADTQALVAAYRGVGPLNAVLITVPAGGPDAAQLKLQPGLEGKLADQGKATAYVCEHGTCQTPTQDPAQLKRELVAAWKH